MGMTVIVVLVAIMIVMMLEIIGMLVRFVLMVLAVRLVRAGLEIVMLAFAGMALEDLCLGRGIGACALDDRAADAIAMAAAARVAVA